MQCSRRTVSQTVAPSAFDASFLSQPGRQMTTEEIAGLVQAYADAARRAQEAGNCPGHGRWRVTNGQPLSSLS
jgi:2,4-dienoyl-CoA reductase-like NADH-dependent reductase (Old Yellow Enzyme family)